VSGDERDTLTGIEAAVGSIEGDIVRGTAGADPLLAGAEGDDRLFGRAGNDLLSGGPGEDQLTGGPGRDRFAFAVDDGPSDNPRRDVVADFARGEDRLDLAGIDADPDRSGNQAFAFLGTVAFSETAGQVRFEAEGSDTIVQADADGDGYADIEIKLTGRLDLAATDFLL
jgi:serralysin